MNQKEIIILQASIDHIHGKLMSVYGELMSSNVLVTTEAQRKTIKQDICTEWTASYMKAKQDASAVPPQL